MWRFLANQRQRILGEAWGVTGGSAPCANQRSNIMAKHGGLTGGSAPVIKIIELYSSMLIEGKYQVSKYIGGGTFGKVYKGVNINTGQAVAVKFESARSKSLLLHEARMYVALQTCAGVSPLRSFGTYDEYHYIVVDLYERDLEEVVYHSKEPISIELVLRWGHEILRILETIHKSGIVHRDIKPENVMLRGEKMYLIDFGLARHFREHSGKHAPMKAGRGMLGTMRYASMNVHNGYTPSRRDDLESLGYVLLFFYHQTLPWKGIRNVSSREQETMVKNLKSMNQLEQWCVDQRTPAPLLSFIAYAKFMRYDERPNYKFFQEESMASVVNPKLQQKDTNCDLDLKKPTEPSIPCQVQANVVQDRLNGSATTQDTVSSPH